MNEALKLVLKLGGRLLWLLIRLVILAVTGSWVSSDDDKASPADDEDLDLDELDYDQPEGVGRVPDHAVQALERRALRLTDRIEGNERVAVLRPFVARELPVLLKRLRSQVDGEGDARQRQAEATYYEVRGLLQYLEAMVDQREGLELATLGDADRVAAACFKPLRDYADAHQLPLSSRTQVSLRGDWGLSMDLSFRDTSLAPVRLPSDFDASPYAWPALAHEVAHDFYFSVRGLEDNLHHRLKLPRWQPLPATARDYVQVDVRQLCGAWLAEIFADAVGALQMGPAYGEAMLNKFADPEDPMQTRLALPQEGYLGPHPPRHLRVRLCAQVLEYLGQHDDARDLEQRWDAQHPAEEDAYFLPAADQSWLQLPADVLQAPASEILASLLSDRWPRLAGTRLLDIPGFVYLHAEHARVQRMVPVLSRGDRVDGPPRLVIAAAVLAAAAGGREDVVMRGLRHSVVGVGTVESARDDAYARPHQRPYALKAEVAGTGLAAAFRDRRAVREAIALGEALGRRG